MGSGNYVICKQCSYEKEFYLGMGMMYYDLERLISYLDKDNNFLASEIFKKDKDVQYTSEGESVYQCANCFSIQQTLHLVIKSKDNKILFRTKSHCKKCDNPRKRVNMEQGILQNFVCPKCKNTEVIIDNGLCWD